MSFSDKLEVTEITKDALYVGLRISFIADVAGVHCDMKVDIGFSDEIYPAALMLDYPATLNGIPGARLQCYPPNPAETSATAELFIFRQKTLASFRAAGAM